MKSQVSSDAQKQQHKSTTDKIVAVAVPTMFGGDVLNHTTTAVQPKNTAKKNTKLLLPFHSCSGLVLMSDAMTPNVAFSGAPLAAVRCNLCDLLHLVRPQALQSESWLLDGMHG